MFDRVGDLVECQIGPDLLESFSCIIVEVYWGGRHANSSVLASLLELIHCCHWPDDAERVSSSFL